MATLQSPDQLPVFSDAPQEAALAIDQPADSSPASDSKTTWSITTISALSALVVLWAVKFYTTWGAWGNLTVDSGHEMYIPALLAEGKQLYRDVFFNFGPAAPYFNGYLFRLFGIRLNVLYWAGSLSALGSAVFLYLAGVRLSSWVIGWTAGAVVLLEAFQPSLFSFPMPYSFAAAYGCLVGCLFVWLIVNASISGRRSWIFAGGCAAAVGLMLKPEFGLASYGTLAVFIAIRGYSQRSWSVVARDVAAILPGVIALGFVIRWMVSIAGVDFITQENIQSWPTNYFMKTYGKLWLAQNGFTISIHAFLGAAYRTIPLAFTLIACYYILWRKRSDRRSKLLITLFSLIVVWYFVVNSFFVLAWTQSTELILSKVFFPRDMVLYTVLAAGAAWLYFWLQNWLGGSASLTVPLLLAFTTLLSFRILMKMAPEGYAIFYNGPVVLSYLLLLSMVIPRSGRSRRRVLIGEMILCVGCLIPVAIHSWKVEERTIDYVPLTTERGTIRVSKDLAENYTAAIQFMKEKAALGQSVLSVPEDTSLYFLSGTYCPTRVFLFIPGAVAPGIMTDKTIAEIEKNHVVYLLWSNRQFPEYGAKEFGKDFNIEIGDYLKAHYRPIGPLTARQDSPGDWTATVWERKPDGGTSRAASSGN